MKQNDFQVFRIEPGNMVICDICSEDWTDREQSGGILLQSKAVCPECAPKMLESLAVENELRFVRGHCPEGKSFADWVRDDLR